jgi:hypothetical protein
MENRYQLQVSRGLNQNTEAEKLTAKLITDLSHSCSFSGVSPCRTVQQAAVSDSDTCSALRIQCIEGLYDYFRDPSLRSGNHGAA